MTAVLLLLLLWLCVGVLCAAGYALIRMTGVYEGPVAAWQHRNVTLLTPPYDFEDGDVA